MIIKSNYVILNFFIGKPGFISIMLFTADFIFHKSNKKIFYKLQLRSEKSIIVKFAI